MCRVPSLITRGPLSRRDDDGMDPEASETQLRPLFGDRPDRARDLLGHTSSPPKSKPRWRHARLPSESAKASRDQRCDERNPSVDGLEQLERIRVRRSGRVADPADRKSTRLNSSHLVISYAVFCLKKKH